MIGVGGGGHMELDLMQLMLKRARIGGLHPALPQPSGESGRERLPWRHTSCHPSPRRGASPFRSATSFPMAEAEAAYERFAQGAKLGKVVLVT